MKTGCNFGSTLYDRVLPILNYGIDTNSLKEEILKEISSVSEAMEITEKDIDSAYNELGMFFFMEFEDEAVPSENEIKTAMLSWKNVSNILQENISTERLNNIRKTVQRVKDNPIERAYVNALRPKIRAQQLVNSVGVHAILYNKNGIINGELELSEAIRQQLEELFLKVSNYLNKRGIRVEDTLYKDGKYTGIIEKLHFRFADEEFNLDFNDLNRLYANGDFETLDAYTSWIVLNNFDTIISQSFGKAINIDLNKSEFDLSKYSFGGGTNVYTTWRTNEEINLSKEINNISLLIVNSLPYYVYESETPKFDRNVKFSEFIYIISKIKDLPLHLTEIPTLYNDNLVGKISRETLQLIKERTFPLIINLLRDNPQKYLPQIFELLNNDTIFKKLSLELDYFLSVDRDLIKSLYKGLFDKSNQESLAFIQELNLGYLGTNYLAFVALTIDSIFKSSFLLYFRDSEGKLYVRPMFDLSISSIEYNIKNVINRTNSIIIADETYSSHKLEYNIHDDSELSVDYLQFPIGTTLIASIDNNNYYVLVLNNLGNFTYEIVDTHQQKVTDENLLKLIDKQALKLLAKPNNIYFTIKNFHKGPLDVSINLTTGKINYSLNGTSYNFIGKADYESLLNFILDILKLNLHLDPEFLRTYLDRQGTGSDLYGSALSNLMRLATVVLANQHVSETFLKGLSPSKIRAKVDEIYSDLFKPTYNKKTNEINLLTSIEEGSYLRDLAVAKALVTGKLTSSQIVDGSGNHLASQTLSRLANTLPYQIETLISTQIDSAAKDFTLWKNGVYKGIAQLKEFKEGKNTKALTGMSVKELESASVFIDFVHGLVKEKTSNSPLKDGIVMFYPSENSDKTYVGRILIDLNKVPFEDGTLYDLIKNNPSEIDKFYPIIRKELGDFYLKAELNINSDWKRLGDYLGVQLTWDNLSELERLASYERKTPYEYMSQKVTEYNNTYPTNPIVLTDLVHYIADKEGNFKINGSFLANLTRFSSEVFFENFIYLQNLDVVGTLLDDEVSIDATPDIRALIGDEWIDPYTNKVILAKGYDPEGELIENIRRGSREVLDGHYGIEINPLIKSYNVLNYFFTQEYMNSSVGAYYAHPNKKGQIDYNTLERIRSGIADELEINSLFLKDEEFRKLALDKRNVSMTASMHSFLKNLILGIPSEINVAVLPDVFDEFQTISGDNFSITPYDGATFTNPFYQILLNNSLGGARVGLIKKTFTHYYDARTGTGGIIKTAEFPLTNEYIRRSRRLEIMMQNMTDREWRDENGELLKNFDITTDYNGKLIDFSNLNCVKSGQLFYLDSNTGKYYAFWIEKASGNNEYIKLVQEVDEHGDAISDELLIVDQEGNYYRLGIDSNGVNVLQNILNGEIISNIPTHLVDTNYKLWKMFGGDRSMEIRQGNNILTQSEHSINIVVKIMNNTGIKNSDVVKYLSDIWQPLKHSDIHIMPTVGAVKQGAANINSKNVYLNPNSKLVNFYKVKMNQSGVLLDKEHHADGEDLSIMSLVISACASRGYTQEQCEEMYNALSSLAESGIRPYLKSFEEFFTISTKEGASPEELEQARQNFESVLTDTLIKALVNSTNNSATLLIVSQKLIEMAKEGKVIKYADLKIPFSDPSVMRRLHSTIAVALTSGAIKIKVDGILSILCPSFEIIKLYNGKTRDQYLNDNEIISKLEEQDTDESYNLISTRGILKKDKIKIGRTYKLLYKDGREDLLINLSVEDYWKLNSLAPYLKSIREQFAPMELVLHELTDPDIIESELFAISDVDKRIQKAIELGLPVETDLTPRNLVEIVADSWNFKLNSDSFREESGIQNFQLEGKLAYFDNKVGISITRASEIIAENYADPNDLPEIRNIIIDFVTNYTPSEVKNYIKNNRIEEALSLYRSEYDSEESLIKFEGGRELGSYNVTFNGIEVTQEDSLFGALFLLNPVIKSFNLYDLVSVKELYEVKKRKGSKLEIDDALEKLQEDLNTLHKRKGQVLTNEGLIEIDSNSIQIEPYEIVMPKIFASVFGLTIEDNLEEIKNDREFFVKRLLENIKKIKTDNYDLALTRMNGNHIYLLDPDKAILTDTFRPKLIQRYRENGKLYRKLGDDLLYEMNPNDEVWEHILTDGTTVEVIITRDFDTYLKGIDYNSLNINSGSELKMFNLLQKHTSIPRVREYINSLHQAMQYYQDSLENAVRNTQIISISDINDSPVGDYFLKLGHKIHSSFLKSLEIIAARIPALSMLSFMPMKIVAFEKSDRNTAYVSTTQILFQGSDYDVDAVSLASFSIDKSGQYIMHSPYANIDTYENLKASENIPFPTGKSLEVSENDEFDYQSLITFTEEDQSKPFIINRLRGAAINTNNPESINTLANFIRKCNKLGYIPKSTDPLFNPIVDYIKSSIDKHNNYIHSNTVEQFSKNFVVSSMYNIGLSPANLVESQLAMDSITGPLKEVANHTLFAIQKASGNPANYTTNIHGFVQNMDGKQGVGICAVGLKSFFGLTARYNEVLANGSKEEVNRLKSDVEIARQKFTMLANAHSTNEVNSAILGNIITELDKGTDVALILSGLLSLATDNAKELALTKLNAANMLGMYIYGISLGMDFQSLANLIASNTGKVLNSLLGNNFITEELGMNFEKIFDYIETGPKFDAKIFPDTLLETFLNNLSLAILNDLAWSPGDLNEKLLSLERLKTTLAAYSDENKNSVIEYNRTIEKALDYIRQINIIKNDSTLVKGQLIYINQYPNAYDTLTALRNGTNSIYGSLKKLNKGAEEFRRLGQLLHINLGNETSYSKALSYIDKVESVLASASYRQFREKVRRYNIRKLYGRLNENEKYPEDISEKYEFNFHDFIFDKDYREAKLDLYDGKINEHLFINSESYRKGFKEFYSGIMKSNNITEQLEKIKGIINPLKEAYNILDVLQVPHYESYIKSADMLHLYMQNSLKYRTVYTLGKEAIKRIGAYSSDIRENIFRRTEQLVDRIIRDRFYRQKEFKFNIPQGTNYFKYENGKLIKKIADSPYITIELGTIAGNASFKLLMEKEIIPKLLSMPDFLNNKFIKSLAITLYDLNPYYLTTTCIAPNINMSPRSDSDMAIFEEVKNSFNEFRTSRFIYKLGNTGWSLIDLFYFYNLIAFGGRVGENTMTNIFQNVLDFGFIKMFRDFEADLDRTGKIDLELEISTESLIKEVAPRDNYLSNLNFFYNEDPLTGEISFVSKNKSQKIETEEGTVWIGKFSNHVITPNAELKNYVLSNYNDSDTLTINTKLGTLYAFVENGIINEIVDKKGNNIPIPKSEEYFFKNPPIITRITSNGIEKVYDINLIESKTDEIISCKL